MCPKKGCRNVGTSSVRHLMSEEKCGSNNKEQGRGHFASRLNAAVSRCALFLMLSHSCALHHTHAEHLSQRYLQTRHFFSSAFYIGNSQHFHSESDSMICEMSKMNSAVSIVHFLMGEIWVSALSGYCQHLRIQRTLRPQQQPFSRTTRHTDLCHETHHTRIIQQLLTWRPRHNCHMVYRRCRGVHARTKPETHDYPLQPYHIDRQTHFGDSPWTMKNCLTHL